MSRLNRLTCLVFGHDYELRPNPLLYRPSFPWPPPMSSKFECVRCGHESLWGDGKP